MRDLEQLILSIRNSAVRRGALAGASKACKEKYLKLGQRKRGSAIHGGRAKLHNRRTELRRHDLTTTDLDRQIQSSTTATGLEVHSNHRHRASEVSRESKTNSRAAEPVCHSITLVVNVREINFFLRL